MPRWRTSLCPGFRVVTRLGALAGRDFFFDRFRARPASCCSAREGAVFVENIGDAARHAGSEVAPGHAEHDDRAAGHVFATVVADAFDDGGGPELRTAKAFAGDAAKRPRLRWAP